MESFYKIFKDQQLTPYRVRKNGYSGFFFYLAENDVIYLVDNPARSDKEIEHNVTGLLLKEKEMFENLFSSEDPENISVYPKSWFDLYKITPVIGKEWAHVLYGAIAHDFHEFLSRYCADTYTNAPVLITLLTEQLSQCEDNALLEKLCCECLGYSFEVFKNSVFRELMPIFCNNIKTLSPEKFEQMTYALLHGYQENPNNSVWMMYYKPYYEKELSTYRAISPLDKIIGYISLMYWVKTERYMPSALIPEEVADLKLSVKERTEFYSYFSKYEIDKIKAELESDDQRLVFPSEDECKRLFAEKLKHLIIEPSFMVNVSDRVKEKALQLAYGWIQYMLPETFIEMPTLHTAMSKSAWPTEYYTSSANVEDKITFEDFLVKLCHSQKKSMTADIKNYLKVKEDQGIIIRPKQINAEFEIVKLFGYPYKDKAYYNG